MKTLFLMTLLSLSTTSFALDLPTGDYQHTNTQVISTKHFHQLYHRSSKEQVTIENYRSNGYLCKRRNVHITECSKVVELNPNKIAFKTEKLAKLSPLFSENIEGVKELSNGEAVAIYEIEQENSTNEHQNKVYKVYDITDSGFYVDLKKDETRSVRFEFVSSRVLTHFSFQKEKLSKREHYKHSLLSYYVK